MSYILDELGRSSESPITLNCPTTGLLPTLRFWRKNGIDLVAGSDYEISTELRSRENTTFDNFLHLFQTPQQAQGIYQCIALSDLDGPVQRFSGAMQTLGIVFFPICMTIIYALQHYFCVVDYFISMYTVGGSESLYCTFSDVQLYTWTDEENNTLVDGRQLYFSSNDSIHHTTFTCIGFNSLLIEYSYVYVKIVVNGKLLRLGINRFYNISHFTVPDTVLGVRAQSDISTPVLGQLYSMNCVGYKVVSGLSNLPTPQWLTLNGNPLSSGVQLQDPVAVGSLSSSLAAYFSILRTSHAGNYSCRASLSSPALTTPLVKTTYFGVTVQRMSISMKCR